jgi:hypothetical protein
VNPPIVPNPNDVQRGISSTSPGPQPGASEEKPAPPATAGPGTGDDLGPQPGTTSGDSSVGPMPPSSADENKPGELSGKSN